VYVTAVPQLLPAVTLWPGLTGQLNLIGKAIFPTGSPGELITMHSANDFLPPASSVSIVDFLKAVHCWKLGIQAAKHTFSSTHFFSDHFFSAATRESFKIVNHTQLILCLKL
jgi:hypothetical protein